MDYDESDIHLDTQHKKKSYPFKSLSNQHGLLIGSIITVIILLAIILVAILKNPPQESIKPQLSLSDILAGKYSPKSIEPQWFNDGTFIYLSRKLDRSIIYQYLVSNSSETVFVDSKDLILDGIPYGNKFTTWEVSSDKRLVLFGLNPEKQFRHSFYSQWIVFNVATKISYDLLSQHLVNFSHIPKSNIQSNMANDFNHFEYLDTFHGTTGNKRAPSSLGNLQYKNIYDTSDQFDFVETTIIKGANPTWVPTTESTISVVVAGNIYVFENLDNPASIKVTQVTNDGDPYPSLIINGMCDWLYEEEILLTSRAMWWSPDGQTLAFIKFNDTLVGEVPYPWFEPVETNVYPEFKRVRYPKAGKTNPTVSVHVFFRGDAKTDQISLSENTEYVTGISWIPYQNDVLVVRESPRLQQVETITLYNTSSHHENVPPKNLTSYITQSMPNGWVEARPSSIHWVNSTHFVDFKAKDDHFLIALQTPYMQNQPITYLTQVDDTVPVHICGIYYPPNSSLSQIDPSSILIMYTAYSPYNSGSTFLRAVDMTGKQVNLGGETIGTYSCSYGASSSAIFQTYSSAATPPVQSLKKIHLDINTNDKFTFNEVVLVSNHDLLKNLNTYQLPTKKFSTMNILNNKLNYYMIYPSTFSASSSYPLLVTYYQRPNSATAVNSCSLGFNQWVADALNIIVLCIDGRGTMNPSISFTQSVFKHLGEFETLDQLAGIREILKTHQYIDYNRIAVWGWSYGGFMSINLGLQNMFMITGAISVAPVTDWRLYDTFYTEKYMTTPDENPAGYNSTSLIEQAKTLAPYRFSDPPTNMSTLYLIHGLADDNVHFQNSALFVSQLIKTNTQLRTAYYPNADHSISTNGSLLHIYTSISNFLKYTVINYTGNQHVAPN